MAVDMRISNAVALVLCDAIVDALDAGTGGYIRIYDGSVPTNVDAAATGTLLAQLTLSQPAFGSAADINPGARATANTITSDSSADATGTASYFRAFRSDGTAILQGTAGIATSDMILTTVSIVIGSIVSVSSWTVSVSESS